MSDSKIIIFQHGTMKGVEAFVTWEDSKYMRVTPIDGDPMWSLEVNKKTIPYIVKAK